MSNARYLEIDSRFRDRNLWPISSEFEIPISQSGRKGSTDAVDPVSDAAVLTSFTPNRFNSLSTTGATLTVTIDIPPLGSSGNDSVLIVTAPCGYMQVMPDYYHAAVMRSSVIALLLPFSQRRITKYTFLGTDGVNDRARFTLAQPFTTGYVVAGNQFTIDDPTSIPGGGSAPIYFIPGPLLGENILVRRIIYNETQDQSRPLLVYDQETATVQVDITGSSTNDKLQGPVIWTLTDTYSIRTTTPIFKTQLNGEPNNNPSTKTSFNFLTTVTFPTDSLLGSFLELLPLPPTSSTTGTLSPTSNVITLGGNIPGAPTDLALQDFYVGYDVRITGPALGPSLGEIRRIIAYNIVTNVATVDRNFSAAPTALTTYSLFFPTLDNISVNLHQARRIIKWVNFSGVTPTASASSSVMEFPPEASDITGYYNELYITTTIGFTLNRRMIQSYVVTKNSLGVITSRTATVYNAFSGVPLLGQAFSITSGITLPFTFSISQQTTPPFVAQTFALLPFTADNLVPFVYTGSLVSQQEMVCYEIELLNLILPNTTLGTAYGSLISFYQYVYVELRNVSAPGAGNHNIIYSNNPNSTRMLFRCPIKDVPNPTSSTFIKIDGNGMKQTIKFKPNDNLRFSVRMSTGELFKTLAPEIFGPNSSDPITQISACFSMKRL